MGRRQRLRRLLAGGILYNDDHQRRSHFPHSDVQLQPQLQQRQLARLLMRLECRLFVHTPYSFFGRSSLSAVVVYFCRAKCCIAASSLDYLINYAYFKNGVMQYTYSRKCTVCFMDKYFRCCNRLLLRAARRYRRRRRRTMYNVQCRQ